MLTGPLENMKKPAFSGHETFPYALWMGNKDDGFF